MEPNEDLFFKIEDYLKGKLSREEAIKMEREMAGDPNLAELVEKQRLENEGLEYLVEEELLTKIQEWEADSAGQKNSGRGNRNFLLSILLGVLILCIVGFLLIPKGKDTIPEDQNPAPEAPLELQPEQIEKEEPPTRENQEPPEDRPVAEKQENQNASPKYLAVFSANYEVPEHLKTYSRTVEEQNPETTLESGLKAFVDSDWSTVIEEFSRIDSLQSPSDFRIANEYLAHAYLQARQFAKATGIFESMVPVSDGSALDRTEWYLMLSLLPDHRRHKKQIDLLLDKMIDPDSYHAYFGRAKEVRSALQQLTE